MILCDTGIALLAYMDGITGSPTLGGVVLAASAAAGSAVYKVMMTLLFYLQSVDPPTWCTYSNRRNVMLFILEKKVRCSRNV